MAIYFNGTSISSINFNGTNASAVYFNGTKVWPDTNNTFTAITNLGTYYFIISSSNVYTPNHIYNVTSSGSLNSYYTSTDGNAYLGRAPISTTNPVIYVFSSGYNYLYARLNSGNIGWNTDLRGQTQSYTLNTPD